MSQIAYVNWFIEIGILTDDFKVRYLEWWWLFMVG